MLGLYSCWFLYFLGLFIVQASQLTCPFNKIRALDAEDVMDYHVDQGYGDLLNLISSNYADFTSNYFRSNTIPNKGNITLSENFLFTGFTTKGIRGTNPTEEFYVSQFSIKIITNSNATSVWPSINKVFTVETADEVYFPLYPVVPSYGIWFTVNNFTVTPASLFFYFWKLRLFGCDERNAIDFPRTAVFSFNSSEVVETTSVKSVIHSLPRQFTRSETMPAGGVTRATDTLAAASSSCSPSRSDDTGTEVFVSIIVLLLLIILLLITVLLVGVLLHSKRIAKLKLKNPISHINQHTMESSNIAAANQRQVDIIDASTTLNPAYNTVQHTYIEGRRGVKKNVNNN